MNLNLRRPIIFFDLETTGLNLLEDRIVEISVVKVMPNGEEIVKTRRINPGIPIPAESTAVHHITDDDVKDCPAFKQLARSLAEFFKGCDIAGFNSNRFDIPMLDEEMHRAGIDLDWSKARFIDVQTIFHKKEQRNLVAAYRFYCDKDLEGAHSANADTLATYEVLKAQLDRYPDLENDVERLAEFSTQNRNVDLSGRIVLNDKDEAVINFGKYKGKRVTDVFDSDPGYYGWILGGDFSGNTKRTFTRLYMSHKAAKKK